MPFFQAPVFLIAAHIHSIDDGSEIIRICLIVDHLSLIRAFILKNFN
jgi:hypothetical protein